MQIVNMRFPGNLKSILERKGSERKRTRKGKDNVRERKGKEKDLEMDR